MKIGFQVVLFLLCLNLVSGLMYTVSVPGTEYSYGTTGVGNASDYETRFNSTAFMAGQQPGIIESLTYLGNIYGVIMMFWNAIEFVINGFPKLLENFQAFIPSASGRTAFQALTLMLRAIFGLIIFTWLFQIITGRNME